MPKKKPVPNAVVLTPTIAVADGSFGDALAVTVTDAPPNAFVRAQAWLDTDAVRDDDTDVLDYWLDVGEEVQAGPTASWTGGAADGRAQLVSFALTPNQDPVATVVATATFRVSAS